MLLMRVWFFGLVKFVWCLKNVVLIYSGCVWLVVCSFCGLCCV